MEVMSKAKFIRIAPRKTRLLAGLVRGLTLEEARRQLTFSAKEAARPMLKAINSAVANAIHNHKLSAEGMIVSRVIVDEGPKIKRYTPRAQGRATPIRLRMSHITVWVKALDAAVQPQAQAVKPRKAKTTKSVEVTSTTK